MEKIKKPVTKKVEETVPVPQNGQKHKEKIKLQILAQIGKPPRLDRVELCEHHGGRWRVNIWEQPEPDKNIAVTKSPRIGLSYYLHVSDEGDIVSSNPPLKRLYA